MMATNTGSSSGPASCLFSVALTAWVWLGDLFSKLKPGDHQTGGSPLDTSVRIEIQPLEDPHAPLSSSTPAKPGPPPCGCSCKAKAEIEISNKLAEALYNLEMVKTYITLVFPVATIILACQSKDSDPKLKSTALCFLCFALPFLLCACTIRIICPVIAVAIEQLGTALIHAAFFLIISAHLPEGLIWIPILCFILCIIISLGSCLPFAKRPVLKLILRSLYIGGFHCSPFRFLT